MKNLNRYRIFILFITSIFTSTLLSQKVDPDHKLLWKISSPTLEQVSYIYGTMHIRDPRVFNFSDSLYVKIDECKHFALEVHPDTIVKNLIVDPFNSAIDKSIENELFAEEMDEYKEELKDKTGIDFSGISKENLDIIPLILDKIFKKGKDKNTFLDAHLYHIAKILKKNIVGLETLNDHKLALRSFSNKKDIALPKLIERQKSQRKIYTDMIETYSSGKIEELFNKGNFAFDTILAFRNKVMVNSSVDYIEDGGLFMAVGAAHLAGKEGMLQLLREKGYKVEAVQARFSKKMHMAELPEKEVDWIIENYPDEGFSVSIPDHAYNYRPESIGGVFTVRSYPDLGIGQFFFYAAYPIMVQDFDLLKVEEQAVSNIESRGGTVRKRDIKYGKYLDIPMLEIKYNHYGSKLLFRYISYNNYIYVFGVMPMNKGAVDKKTVNRFFKSVNFSTIKKSNSEEYSDKQGAFKVKTNLNPQSYKLEDKAEGYNTITEYTNFINPESRLMHIVTYSFHEAGYILDNSNYSLNGYEYNFVTGNDSLVSLNDTARYGGKEIHVIYDDNTFVKALSFIRGNRLYQVYNSGAITEENYAKSDQFIKNFEITDYQDFESIKFENESFTSNFPEYPRIDTTTESYSLNHFSTKSIQFAGLDKKSGLNFLVVEDHISPYATFENIDTCFTKIQSVYKNYNDSLFNERMNDNIDSTIFEFKTRSQINQLDYQYKLIFDYDKLYTLYLIQDSSAINEKAIDQFIHNFRLKNKPRKSILLRDSSVVKQIVLQDLFSNDTTQLKASSEVVSSFNFSKNEMNEIFNEYKKNIDLSYPDIYHENMLELLSKHKIVGLDTLMKRIYLDSISSSSIKISVLKLLIQDENPSQILLAKELLHDEIPSFKDNWEINSIFYTMNHSVAHFKPLFPEILQFDIKDSTIILGNLYNKLLRDSVIDYNTLEPIHNIILEESQNKFDLIKNGTENESWGEKYTLKNLAEILSYSKADSQSLKIFEYYFHDTLMHFKLEGAKFLLRQQKTIDLSNVYNKIDRNYEIIELYEIKREFDQVEVLPDSMMNINKYIIVSSLAYPEEEEYFENPTTEIIEQFEEDGHLHSLIQCNIKFEYEEAETEEYKLLLYNVIEKQDSNFVVPMYDDIYTDYTYMDDDEDNKDSYEKSKKRLINIYKKSIKN